MLTHGTQRALGAALGIGLACALSWPTSVVWADEIAGTVLDVKTGIHVDLGQDAGVTPGSRLRLIHYVEATHPVTKKRLRDGFALGELTVTKSGHRISEVSADDALRARVAVGDRVELVSAPRMVQDPWLAPSAAKGSGTSPTTLRPDPAVSEVKQANAVHAVWLETLGRPPEERIARWQGFLDADPQNPFADAVRAEIASLKAQVQAEQMVRQTHEDAPTLQNQAAFARLVRAEPHIRVLGPLALMPLRQVLEGRPFHLLFVRTQAPDVDQAWVQVRAAGDETYQRIALTVDGVALRARVPAQFARPTRLEYFVEALDPRDNQVRPVLGSPSAPEVVSVEPSLEPKPEDRSNRSRVSVLFDYVDFDGGLQKGFDQYSQFEIDFMYRFYKPIYSMRLGLGSLNGIGGPKDVIDASPDECRDSAGNLACTQVDFAYAYVELEFKLSRLVALMLRPVVGSARQRVVRIDEPEYLNALGLVTRLRIGDERETNLVLGTALNTDFGKLFEASLTWDVIERFPIVLSVQVTDQPVVADYGVRLIADVGWRKWKWFYPSLRVSYQARDVDHAGFSFGTGMYFEW